MHRVVNKPRTYFKAAGHLRKLYFFVTFFWSLFIAPTCRKCKPQVSASPPDCSEGGRRRRRRYVTNFSFCLLMHLSCDGDRKICTLFSTFQREKTKFVSEKNQILSPRKKTPRNSLFFFSAVQWWCGGRDQNRISDITGSSRRPVKTLLFLAPPPPLLDGGWVGCAAAQKWGPIFFGGRARPSCLGF